MLQLSPRLPTTEAPFSKWRAIAVNKTGQEHLLYTGSSFTAVTEAYFDAFDAVLDLDERSSIVKIDLQQWSGTHDRGNWKSRKSLAIPLEKGRQIDS